MMQRGAVNGSGRLGGRFLLDAESYGRRLKLEESIGAHRRSGMDGSMAEAGRGRRRDGRIQAARRQTATGLGRHEDDANELHGHGIQRNLPVLEEIEARQEGPRWS